MSHLALCPICGRDKTYKSKQSYLKCKDRPCLSCANSMKAGGTGDRYVGGLVRCSKCDETKCTTEFVKRKDGGFYSYCRDCQKVQNKDNFSKKWRYARYGIDKVQFDAMLTNQGGNCRICVKKLLVTYVDHNHETGKVRGLLCRDCNSALGLLRENIDSIKNMITYLENK